MRLTTQNASTLTLCIATGAWVGTATAQDAPPPAPAPTVAERLDLSNGEAPEDFFDALVSGKVSLNMRARAEIADQDGLQTSQAYTLRTRLGYKTQAYSGLQFYIEMEDVSSPNDDLYNAAGLNGQPTKTVVADPEVTELNQFWVNYAVPVDGMKLDVKSGRQVIALDDQRFIGHVGWRQDNQTFDAINVKTNLGIDGLSATYAYLWQINRIFAESADFDSDSHLFNLSYDVDDIGKVTGFVYLLDFEGDSPANSSQTYGVRLAGKKPVGDNGYQLAYQASVAFQQDYADNPTDYDATYYMVDAGLIIPDVGTVGAGYEVLGSDDGAFGFRTPLATGHKFNGFADVFLVTPADGLEDFYVYFKPANLPAGLKGMLAYHYFSGNDSIGKFGQEVNAVLTKKLRDNLTAGAKYSYFFGDEPGFADRARLTLDLTLAF